MKTLIIYGTKYEFTKKCIEKIASSIKGTIEIVHLKEPSSIDLSMYNQVIIGGSIYMGNIQKEVKEFCIKYVETLRNKRIGLFICCGYPEKFEEYMKDAFPLRLSEIAITKRCFGGELNVTKMKLIDRLLTKLLIHMRKKEGKSLPIMLNDQIELFTKALNIL
jgi:menaquinone-dependent protoporphyrinogen oxidase